MSNIQFAILVFILAPVAYIAWIGVVNDVQVALHNRKLKKQMEEEERLNG